MSTERVIQLGFMPLVDAAPVVVAARLGLDLEQGVRLQLQRQSSWAAIRDKLLSGELEAVHALGGLVQGVQFGIGGVQDNLAVLLTLNQNGQAIVLSRTLEREVTGGVPLRDALAELPRRPVFAQTFPTGTHAMWLYYWLAANHVHPLEAIENLVIPPPRMAEALAAGELDGYCCGEPWAFQAEVSGVGRRVMHSGEIWAGHPEKVLACRRDLVELEPDTAVALTAAILAACRWLDADQRHRAAAAQWLADDDVIGGSVERIAECLGVDTSSEALDHPAALRESHTAKNEPQTPRLRFHAGGAVNVPYLSDGLWFASQFYRWGMLAQETTAQRCEDTIASLHRLAEYRQAAARIGVVVPASGRRQSTLFDGIQWSGADPLAYARRFPIRHGALRA